MGASAMIPVVLRNKTRFPLVFRHKAPYESVFRKATTPDGSPPTLEPGGVLMVDTEPGALWQGSIPSSEYVYGNEWSHPYEFLQVRVPLDVTPGQVLDVSESTFVGREPMKGDAPTHPVPIGAVQGVAGAPPMGPLGKHQGALVFGGVALLLILGLAAFYFLWWKRSTP